MIDYSSQWIIQQLQQRQSTNTIWCMDENVLHQLPTISQWQHKPLVITNRWDIAQQAQQQQLHCEFSDFDFSNIADNSVDHFFYRISKEKAVTHHIINEAQRVLKMEGQLWLSGQKNEGIKTYIEKASALFGCEKKINKDGANYYSHLTKTPAQGEKLADDNYAQLRKCITVNNRTFFSKPGQFGWSKIDEGSELLISALEEHIAPQLNAFECALDLGCGYGFLSIASQHLNVRSRILTDNNAAALISAKQNCEELALNAEIVASDAGVQLAHSVDLILCNPPFHQGFTIDGDLTDKFLSNAYRLLSENGVAYFVVNEFIPLEKKALALFKHVKNIAQNKRFKVFALTKK